MALGRNLRHLVRYAGYYMGFSAPSTTSKIPVIAINVTLRCSSTISKLSSQAIPANHNKTVINPGTNTEISVKPAIPANYNKATGTKATKYDFSKGTVNSDYNITWLRENCKCSDCFNATTGQRNVLPHLIPDSLQIADVQIKEEAIIIKWNDGHTSVYKKDFLHRVSYSEMTKHRRHFWNRLQLEKFSIDPVPFPDYVQHDTSVAQVLQNLADYGVAFVDGVDASVEGTKAAVERISPALETFFGRYWSFTSSMEDHKDTAYSNVELGPHNDGTYFTIPPGLQVFHCLHAGKGGETILVDGFKVAQELRESDPEAFNILSTTHIPHSYHEPGVSMESLDTIIKTHPVSGDLIWFRYNHYDRSAIDSVPQQQICKFYRALNKLSCIVERSENHYYRQLSPGTVLFVDNWRVMHGRMAFTGHRVMCGCYVSRDDWMSRARTLNVVC